MLENIENPSLFEPSAIVVAGVIVVIVALFWKYGLGLSFGPSYGGREKKNVNLDDSLLKTEPKNLLFIHEGYNLRIGNDGNFIQWVKEAANRGALVRILLMDTSKTYGLENLKNISISKTEESGLGIILADNGKNIAAYIQEVEGSIFTPQVFQGRSHIDSFNKAWKDSRLSKY